MYLEQGCQRGVERKILGGKVLKNQRFMGRETLNGRRLTQISVWRFPSSVRQGRLAAPQIIQ